MPSDDITVTSVSTAGSSASAFSFTRSSQNSANSSKKRKRRKRRHQDEDHPIGRALLLVVGLLVALPALFTYHVLHESLRGQNICHVGPVVQEHKHQNSIWYTPLQPNRMNDPVRFGLERQEVSALYGTYTTFDDASYYFVKTPYEIRPQGLPRYGWWSLTTIAVTLLSPKARQARQEYWKANNDGIMMSSLSPSIQWDQTHRVTPLALQNSPDHQYSPSHSSRQNRWCLVNHHHDPKNYKKEEKLSRERFQQQEEEGDWAYKKSVFGSKAMELVKQQELSSLQLMYKICALPQPSILSNGNQAPFFVELPLQAPSTGRWQRFEPDSTKAMLSDVNDPTRQQLLYDYTHHYRDDTGPAAAATQSLYSAFRRKSTRPVNPFQIQVQCHVRDMELQHLAHGTLQPDAEPHMGWEHAETIETPVWAPTQLPGTILILGILLYVHAMAMPPNNNGRHGKRSTSSSHHHSSRRRQHHYPTYRHFISSFGFQQQDRMYQLLYALQRQWYHDSWLAFSWSCLWVYVLGAGLEPMLGAFSFLMTGTVFWLWVGIFIPSSSNFNDNSNEGEEGEGSHSTPTRNGLLWVCFGWSVLLAQILPTIRVGPFMEMTTISLGDSENALKLNLLTVLIGILPFRWIDQWRCGLGCLFFGWFLSHPLSIEIMGAPQWTIPTLLTGHLYWKLTELPSGRINKKDDEMSVLMEASNEDDTDDSRNKNDDNGDCFQDFDEDDVSTATSAAFSFSSRPGSTLCQKVGKVTATLGLYLLFGSWTALTVLCLWTMDWTLVIGHMMTLWLCMGSTLFPNHPLWSLYHMMSCCVLIMMNVMTCVGWYMCFVAITTQTRHTLPPHLVIGTMLIQTIAHAMALIHTATTKHWSTSPRVPFHAFWDHVKTIGEELQMWYYVFS